MFNEKKNNYNNSFFYLSTFAEYMSVVMFVCFLNMKQTDDENIA